MPRWSKKTDQLVQHVASRCRPSFQSELGHWLEGSPRFSAFLTAHQDKVRKKLTTSDDEDSRLDVRAELLIAHLLLHDRRFEVAFEAYGARNVGPDLTVTYRANQRFNLEVTRIRATDNPGDPIRLANVIAGKLRQLPTDRPNGLAIVAHGLAQDQDAVASAARLLKQHAEARDDTFFARRGLQDARGFNTRYLRLGGVFVVDETGAHFWANREARALPTEIASAALQCFSRR